MNQTAIRLVLSVPRSLWERKEPTTVYVLRRSPGRLEQIESDAAEAFLAGAGRLEVPPGMVDLAVVTLRIEPYGDGLGMKPRTLLCRRPVGQDGRLDVARLHEISRRPEKERREALGWRMSDDERTAFFGAFDRLAEGAVNVEAGQFLEFVGDLLNHGRIRHDC
jgi:hypothetical protein